MFGFNGQEKDNQISGVGNSMTAEFWQYDARLGRRWNTDPVVKEWESPYATFHNSPIFYSDAKGDDPEPKKKERSVRKYERKFNRLAKKHSDWTNDQLHNEMERRHNGKRWMWVQAETGSNVSGDGQDHGRYYHAGDLFQDAHPEHARTPPPAPATPPTPLVANNWVLNGPPVIIGNAYFIPTSGTVTLTLNVTGAATNTGVVLTPYCLDTFFKTVCY